MVELNAHIFTQEDAPTRLKLQVKAAEQSAAALLDPAVKDERILAHAGKYRWTDILGMLKKWFPHNTDISDPPENELGDLSAIIPKTRAEYLLAFLGRNSWTTLEESTMAGVGYHGPYPQMLRVARCLSII